MKLNKKTIEQIFFSNIQNKAHLKIRKRSNIRFIITHIFDLFHYKVHKNEKLENATIIFSAPEFLDASLFPGFLALNLKNKHICDLKNGWRFEEYLLSLGFLLNSSLRFSLSKYILKRVERKLNGITFNAFICSFPMPICYFIALVLKERKTKIFTFQHGIYLADYYRANFFEKQIADYNLVWGQVYKDCYIRNGISKKNIIIVNAIINKNNNRDTNKTGVNPVFLGQQLYKVLPRIFTEYNNTISNLIDFYAKHNIQLKYKPHPREDIKMSLSKINRSRLYFYEKKRVQNDFFNSITHAFSVNSTALIQALCLGVKCCQILNPGIPNIDFTKYTSITSLNLEADTDDLILIQDNTFFIEDRFLKLSSNTQYDNSELILKYI
jgi:hypothetical protein